MESCYSGGIDITHVKIKEEPWREDQCKLWVRYLRSKGSLRTLDLDPVAEAYEDQVEDLFEIRCAYVPKLVTASLELLSLATGKPVIWFGDRNVRVLSGIPNLSTKLYAPLAHLSHTQVRKLGAIFDVDDKWLYNNDFIPGGKYQDSVEEYWGLDFIVGIWLAHKRDFERTSQSPLLVNNFDWAGWKVKDDFEKVVMSEVIEKASSVRSLPASTYNPCNLTLLDGPFDVRSPGIGYKSIQLGGVKTAVTKTEYKIDYLQVEGTSQEGETFIFSIYGSKDNLEETMKRVDTSMKFRIENKTGAIYNVTLSLPAPAKQEMIGNLHRMLE